MLDAVPPALLTCLGAKKCVSGSAQGTVRSPRPPVKVRPIALFLITELCPPSAVVWLPDALVAAAPPLVLRDLAHHG